MNVHGSDPVAMVVPGTHVPGWFEILEQTLLLALHNNHSTLFGGGGGGGGGGGQFVLEAKDIMIVLLQGDCFLAQWLMAEIMVMRYDPARVQSQSAESSDLLDSVQRWKVDEETLI